MEKLTIRQFASSDLNAVLEIEKASFEVDAFLEKAFLNLFKRFSDLFIVGEKDNKILGYMITGQFHNKGYVISIAVSPSSRQKGIGSALANFTFEKLKAYGAEHVDVEVRVTNKRGLSFWQQLGFLPLKAVHRFYDDGEDALKMRKILKHTLEEKR